MGPAGPPGPPGLEEPESKTGGLPLRKFYSGQEQDISQIDVSTHTHRLLAYVGDVEPRVVLQVPSDFDSELVGAAMIKDLEKMLSPLGTSENPAVSCLDIALCHGDQFTPGE